MTQKPGEFIAELRKLARRLNRLAEDARQEPETRTSLRRAAAQLEAEADRLESS